MSCDGYVISFMPGSRGRLITNIVYKLANNLSDPIEFTNLNSAHNFINNADTPYLNNINDLVVNKNIRRVFCTHLYPRITWPSNLNVIFINVSSKTLPEVLINAAIKNVFPKLEKQLANEELSDTEKNSLKFTRTCTLN